MDILRQPKFKGDKFREKPIGDYKARSVANTGFAGLFGGVGSAVEKPMFRKGPAALGNAVEAVYTRHGHGSTPNKIKERY